MHSLSDLPFLVFVAVADATHSVGAVEAEAYFRLLERRDWVTCPALVSSLPEASRKYAEHWRQYAAGNVNRSATAVLQAVRSVASRFSPDSAALLEADLLHIADALRKASRQSRLPQTAKPGHAFGRLETALRAADPVETAVAAEVLPAPAASDKPVVADSAGWQAAIITHAQPWDSVHTRLHCVRVADEATDVKTFVFTSEEKRPFSYKPGQFITIEVEIAGKKVRRNYSMSSTPSRPDLIALTVKRVPGGLVSNWLHDQLAVGDVVTAVIANGKFNCWDVKAEKVLMLSAGIGITPVMSMARWHADLGIARDTVFFHITRTPSAILFHHELEDLQNEHFKLIFNCTRPAPNEDWNGLTGRLDAQAVTAAVPDYRERAIFMCGPEPWMKSMREQFTTAGVSTDQIHQEFFGPRSWATSTELNPQPVQANSAGKARIIFSRSHKEVECATDEPILEVAERSGIEIASSCRVGACGTCKALKTSGTVNNGFCPGLEEAEAALGYVLTCSTTAEGIVVIDA